MPILICPKCKGKKDYRSKRCRKCKIISYGWAQDWHLHATGYIIKTLKGKLIYQHRFVMELFLNRKLNRKEHVHHINGNKTDNKIENLELISASNHGKEHMKIKAKQMSIKGHQVRWGYVSNI